MIKEILKMNIVPLPPTPENPIFNPHWAQLLKNAVPGISYNGYDGYVYICNAIHFAKENLTDPARLNLIDEICHRLNVLTGRQDGTWEVTFEDYANSKGEFTFGEIQAGRVAWAQQLINEFSGNLISNPNGELTCV